MNKIEFHPITRRLVDLEIQNNQMQEQLRAQQFVLGWMLARLCPEESRRFLSAQANELEPSGKFEEHVALYDELREEIAQWTEQWSVPHNKPD